MNKNASSHRQTPQRDDDAGRALAVSRCSTLIALKGESDLARIVVGMREAEIKALMDRALSA